MYNKIMRRMNERVERYHGNNGSHNYRSREGANIPKGYGTQFTPVASARLSERVGMARKCSGTNQFRGRQASGHARGVESGALKSKCKRI